MPTGHRNQAVPATEARTCRTFIVTVSIHWFPNRRGKFRFGFLRQYFMHQTEKGQNYYQVTKVIQVTSNSHQKDD